MQLEALMLRSLCAIGTLVCVLVLGAMLFATPATSAAATDGLAGTAPSVATACRLPPDAVVCLRAPG